MPRALFAILLAACATTQKTEDTEIFLFDVVTEHCAIPDLRTFFEFDSIAIDRSDHADLNALARCLTEGPLRASKVEVIGHSDPMGSKTYNKKLSLRRAEEVARYLEKRGVSDERISVRAAGIDDAAPKRQARRVDIKLVDCAIDPRVKCSE